MRLYRCFLVGFVTTLTAVVVFAAAAAAHQWTRVASGGMNVSDQVGLARSSDGVLHVAWQQATSTSTQDLFQTPIAPSGAVGSPVTIVSGWASIGSPALVAQGQALSVFFPGAATLTSGDPTYGLDLAKSSPLAGGTSWQLGPSAIARNEFAFARTPAAVAVSGSYVQAWYGTDSTVVHSGLDPNVPPVGGYGTGTDQALASASIVNNQPAQVMVAWCDELSASPGVYLARVDPYTSNGARIGDVVALRDTGRCPADTRVALASFRDIPRDSPGGEPYFYTAASSADGQHVRVYVVAQGMVIAVQTVAGGPSIKQQIAIATGPSGRIWVGWRDSGTGDLVFRRSDPRSGFVYGASVTVPLPRGQTISQLALDAQNDRLDVVATTSDQNNVVSLFATQVRPGLTLTAGTAKTIERKGFRVLDAGDPVRDAIVRVARRTLVTDSRGYAKTRLPRGSYTATASKPGYVAASVHIRIR